MPSIGSPLPMRRAISIMLFIAWAPFGDCMNSCIAFVPSGVAPEVCIGHVIAASLAGLSDFGVAGGFGSAAVTAGPTTRADRASADTNAKITVFITILPLSCISFRQHAFGLRLSQQSPRAHRRRRRRQRRRAREPNNERRYRAGAGN